jgi:hypothetical protein
MQKWVNSERIDPLINSPRPIANPKISKILVKRRAANGDVLIAGAVASALQKKYPESQIDFCTECGDVLKNNPYINDVLLPQEVRLNQYHIVFDLNYAYERRPYCNILQAYADVVGVKTEDCNLFFDTAVIEPIDGPYVVIQAARTNWVGRNWHVSKFDEIARRLMDRGIKVVCAGTEGEHKVPCDIDCRGQYNIHQFELITCRDFIFVYDFLFLIKKI